MSEPEAIGEVVSGAALARAVEPRAGEVGADGHKCEKACLNCGSSLSGNYCHACGQRAHVHRTLTAFWHDLAHGVLHLDGKIWNTLPLLAWRPGDLTRRYVDGERAKFVSPMALFLFSVFLMFAILSVVGGSVQESTQAGIVTNGDQARSEIDQATEVARNELTQLRQERERLVAARRPTSDIDADIREKQTEIAIQSRISRGFLPEEDAVATVEATRSADGRLTVDTGSRRLDGWFTEAYRKAKQNPNLLFYKLQSNAYKFSWVLIPMSIPLVWLLFLHRRRYRESYSAYDHTVFVTYSIAFMSLGVIMLSLLGWIGAPAILLVLAVLFVPPLHIYRQLRGSYALSAASAIWRTAALIIMALTALTLFGVTLILIGIL